MIEIDRVGHRIGSAQILEDVSFSVRSGEVLVLVGPNGAGKSTLLSAVSGDLAPSIGEVRFDGKKATAWSKSDLARRRAVLPQQSDLSFPFSAAEVVMLGRSPWGESLHDRTIARMAMSLTDTLSLEDRSYPTLSGGERQRVHTARAIAQIWDVKGDRALLLDEPTASLDLAHQHGLMKLALRMAEEGCAVLCILHDLNLAAQYATRIGMLRKGRLLALDRPSAVLTAERIHEVFAVDSLVMPHPTFGCPLVVATGANA